MDTGYPALIADLPNTPINTKPPTVPGAAEPEAPQATLIDPDPIGSPPTTKQIT